MSQTTVSIILLREGRIDIGRYHPGSRGSFPLPLNTGCIMACLRMSGNIPVLRLKLHMQAIGLASTGTFLPNLSLNFVNTSCLGRI